MRRFALGFVLLASCTRVRALTDKDAAAAPVATTSLAPTNPTTALVAFPGAEGFGAHAIGGRGGTVCRVTTLAKSGAGSLQACFDATGRRTVVFDGIPDAWESAHGLDPKNAADGNAPTCDGYTALECYLNEIGAVR